MQTMLPFCCTFRDFIYELLPLILNLGKYLFVLNCKKEQNVNHSFLVHTLQWHTFFSQGEPEFFHIDDLSCFQIITINQAFIDSEDFEKNIYTYYWWSTYSSSKVVFFQCLILFETKIWNIGTGRKSKENAVLVMCLSGRCRVTHGMSKE